VNWNGIFVHKEKPIQEVSEVLEFKTLEIKATGKPIAKVFAFSACGGAKQGTVKTTQAIGDPKDPSPVTGGTERSFNPEEVEEDKCNVKKEK
jgi:hypothetical protein